MTDGEKISRGEWASRLLADPYFNDIMHTIREDAIISLTTKYNEREDHIATIRVIENLRQELQSIVTTGKNAANRQG